MRSILISFLLSAALMNAAFVERSLAAEPTPILLEIPVSCGAAATAYQIQWEPVEETTPPPTSSVQKIPAGATRNACFHLTEPGTFSYLVSEAAEVENRDTTLYTVTIYVEWDSEISGLRAAVTAVSGQHKAESIFFQHQTPATHPTTPSILPSTTPAKRQLHAPKTGTPPQKMPWYFLGSSLAAVAWSGWKRSRGSAKEETK